jgi:gluconokinase
LNFGISRLGFILQDMQYIIGIDIGTSNTKAVAFGMAGEIVANASVSYGAIQSGPGYHEQDPEIFLNAVMSTLEEVVQKIKGNHLAGICFSSAMHGLMAIDKNGKPLTNIITWADLRSKNQAEKLKASEAGERIYKHTGTPIHAMSPLCKLMWMRENDPVLFASAFKFISIKEYIFFKLFGEYVIDHSVASATGLFDIYSLKWYDESLLAAGIHSGQLSLPVSTTYITRKLKKEYIDFLGIPSDTAFIIGASDGCLANLGTNAVDTGDTAVTIGTSGAVRMISRQPQYDSKKRIFNYLLTEEKYVSGGAINNGMVLLKWYAENFSDHSFTNMEGFDWYMEKACSVASGSAGLIFLPYVMGERAPVWDADAKGVFFGIHAKHTQKHFMRSIIEGISFALYQVMKSLEETVGPVNNIYASGGFIHSKKWVQILADVFGMKIHITNSSDASALGAAILALKALGMINDLSDAKGFITVQDTYFPDDDQHRIYMANYAVYVSLYHKLKEEFLRLETLQN